MDAVLAVVKALNSDALCNMTIGTTKRAISDGSCDLEGIVSQILLKEIEQNYALLTGTK